MIILKKEKLKILLIAFIAIFGLFAISANVKADEDSAFLKEEIYSNEDGAALYEEIYLNDDLKENKKIINKKNSYTLYSSTDISNQESFKTITIGQDLEETVEFFDKYVDYYNPTRDYTSNDIEGRLHDFITNDNILNIELIGYGESYYSEIIITTYRNSDDRRYYLFFENEFADGGEYIIIENNGVIKHQETKLISEGDEIKITYIEYELLSITGNLEKETISYTETFNVDEFVESLEITSLEYDLEDLTITVNNGYTANKNKPGIYEIQVIVTDPDNNTETVTKEIEVVDDIKPVISGINSYIKSTANIVAASDIIEGIVANDHIDGKVDVKVHSDTFTGKGNQAGNYLIVVSATDKSGNRALHEIDVKVVNYILDDSSNENVNNWNITNDKIVNLPVNTKFTRVNIIDLLNRVELINAPANSIITYDLDTYTENIGEPGIYSLEFNVKQPNGTSHDHTFTVNIGNYAPGQDSDVIEDVPFNLFDWLDDNGKKMLIWTLAIVAVGGGVYLFIRFRK